MKFKQALKLLLQGKKVTNDKLENDDKYIKLVGDTLYTTNKYGKAYMTTISPTYYWAEWEEYEEVQLTDEEKSVLSAICKLKDYRVSAISVGFDAISNTKYLKLQRKEYRKSSLNYDYDMCLNIDIRYFKGLESNKLYSLEELGID